VPLINTVKISLCTDSGKSVLMSSVADPKCKLSVHICTV